jgi:hypothetical protein
MNQTNVMVEIMKMAKTGGAVDPDDALSIVLALIEHQKMFNPDYGQDVEALMRIGACIWQMKQKQA